MKIGILTQESFNNWSLGRSGSSRIRGRWLVKYWPEAEEYKIGTKYDVIVFQKAYWREMMRDFKGIKILDLCDPDFLEGPKSVGIVELMTYCDACVTSTEALAEEVRKYTNKTVLCIPDRFDMDLFQSPKEHTDKKATRVVWHGYAQNALVLDSTFNYLRQLGLKLLVISDKAIMDADEWIEYDQATVNAHMKTCDISLMPKHSSRKYKSNNKIVESWLCGLPVAEDLDDLKRFINPIERQKEAKEKYIYAKTNYDVRTSVAEYKDLLDSLIRKTHEHSD